MVVGQRRNGGRKVWENRQNKWKQDVSHGNTVEPPKRGHFGNGPFVLSSEVVPISEVHHILMFFAICRSLLVCNSNVELSVLQMHASDFIWTQAIHKKTS